MNAQAKTLDSQPLQARIDGLPGAARDIGPEAERLAELIQPIFHELSVTAQGGARRPLDLGADGILPWDEEEYHEELTDELHSAAMKRNAANQQEYLRTRDRLALAGVGPADIDKIVGKKYVPFGPRSSGGPSPLLLAMLHSIE